VSGKDNKDRKGPSKDDIIAVYPILMYRAAYRGWDHACDDPLAIKIDAFAEAILKFPPTAPIHCRPSLA
jgi:hypothetical protein